MTWIRLPKSCNKRPEQWKTTIDLPHMNLIIFSTHVQLALPLPLNTNCGFPLFSTICYSSCKINCNDLTWQLFHYNQLKQLRMWRKWEWVQDGLSPYYNLSSWGYYFNFVQCAICALQIWGLLWETQRVCSTGTIHDMITAIYNHSNSIPVSHNAYCTIWFTIITVDLTASNFSFTASVITAWGTMAL